MYGHIYIYGVQGAHGKEMEMEREKTKEAIAEALCEERQRSKVSSAPPNMHLRDMICNSHCSKFFSLTLSLYKAVCLVHTPHAWLSEQGRFNCVILYITHDCHTSTCTCAYRCIYMYMCTCISSISVYDTGIALITASVEQYGTLKTALVFCFICKANLLLPSEV